MRQQDARRLAAEFHADFVPTRQSDNLEVIANLTTNTNTPKVLAAVAGWHERKRNRRHQAIAEALRQVSGTKARPANDNRRPQRRAA